MARIRIQIRAQQTSALPGNQLLTISGLSDCFITGGKIGDDRGPCQCMGTAGRNRCPKVLADLHTQNKIRHLFAGKQQLRTNQRLLAGVFDALGFPHARHKMALLIKLAVIGQIRLGDKPQQLATAYHGRAVVELSVVAYRHTDHSHQIQAFAGLQNRRQARFCAAQQRCLQKKITAGISRQAQFRQAEKLHVFRRKRLHRFYNLLHIISTICHAQRRADSSRADKAVLKCGKAVFHSLPSFFTNSKGIIAQQVHRRKVGDIM